MSAELVISSKDVVNTVGILVKFAGNWFIFMGLAERLPNADYLFMISD